MVFFRRQLLQLAAATALLNAASRRAGAERYPSRPVRWIVPMAAGNPPDLTARLISQWLSERLGQPFVIENRPGAGGTIGIEALVRAQPDGYTLLTLAPSSVINATLFAAQYAKLNFHIIRDVAPVAAVTTQAQVMVANPNLPTKTLPEFISYAKNNPTKINMASGGIGSGQHVAGELFKMMAGVNMVHVPYRSSASAIADLIGGQVHVMFTSPVGLLNLINDGKLRALGVTTLSSSNALPGVPPVGNFVPGYEVTSWFGVGVAANSPIEVVSKLNGEINVALDDPRIRRRISEMGATPFVTSPEEFSNFVTDETLKWAEVIKFAGLKNSSSK